MEDEEDGDRTESTPAPPGGFIKANVMNRSIAKFVDWLVVAALSRLLPPVGAFAGLTYLLIADGLFSGQSLGKRLIGLQTRKSETDSAATYRESILRNIPLAGAYLCLAIPYLGWILAVAVVAVEFLLVIGNPQGARLGDEIARTRVIEIKPSSPGSHPEKPTHA